MTPLIPIVIGLAIVLLAVGTPYWLTHRRMTAQHDPAETRSYLEAAGKSAQDVASGGPGRPLEGRGIPRTMSRAPWTGDAGASQQANSDAV